MILCSRGELRTNHGSIFRVGLPLRGADVSARRERCYFPNRLQWEEGQVADPDPAPVEGSGRGVFVAVEFGGEVH